MLPKEVTKPLRSHRADQKPFFSVIQQLLRPIGKASVSDVKLIARLIGDADAKCDWVIVIFRSSPFSVLLHVQACGFSDQQIPDARRSLELVPEKSVSVNRIDLK